ncbi:unnamed protein product [Paramecium primaurelia]|uniref:Insulin-like growth factor binding protein, N-terminal n=1 Tax=Paramecium primaurelia TaxID=5886 RepID=A0A8S1JS70_PARPR|nr:unnamed protein product [Paramecium primaurelia]
MLLIFLFFLIQWINCWNVITSKKIIEPINNDNFIMEDDYLIVSNGSYLLKYEGLQGYRKLHMIFDAKANLSQVEILLKVNGIKRNFLVVEEDFKEFHIEFEHQAPDIKIQFNFDEQIQFSIRNFNLFIEECPKNCKYCLSGYCDLEILDQCEKLRYKNQCVDECPKGYISEFRECIKTSLNQLGLNQMSIDNDIGQTKKFGENQELHVDFGQNFVGWMEIVFNCYGKQQEHYNSILKIFKENAQPELIHPFLPIYYNTQSYKQCKQRFELDCIQVKGYLKMEFQEQNTITIYSYSKNVENTGFWNIDEIKFYDKEIKYYECTINECESCSFNQVCSQCKVNLYLYENQCVKQCPYFTIKKGGKCIKIDEEQKDVSFIIKLDSPFQELLSIFGQKTFDMKEQISFRYENGTTYIGGGLKDNWRRTTFTKQLNLGKHYSIRLMFNLSIENSTSELDCFTYTIDGKTYLVHKNESYIDHPLYHNKNILNLNLGCKISNNGRCVISNYYFMIMKCSPLCLQCVGPLQSDCKAYQKDIDKFDYQKQKCLEGYYLDDYGCIKCSVGCLICETYNKCLKCKDDKDGEFYCLPYI